MVSSKNYLKLCGDDTIRLMQNKWILLNICVLAKHYAPVSGTYAFLSTFWSLLFAIVNKEAKITYGSKGSLWGLFGWDCWERRVGFLRPCLVWCFSLLEGGCSFPLLCPWSSLSVRGCFSAPLGWGVPSAVLSVLSVLLGPDVSIRTD